MWTTDPPRRRSQPRWRWLHRVGIVLVVVGVISMLALFFSTYGDPALDVWVGVTQQDGELVVVTAPCPSEAVIEVEIQLPGTWEEPGQTLWRVEGSAPMPETIVVGSAPAAMTTAVNWDSAAMREPGLVLFVNTDRAFTWGGVRYEFDPARVREGEILTNISSFASYADFVAAKPDSAECEPWEAPGWWIAITGLGFLVLLPIGIVLVARANRPLPREAGS